MITAIIMASGYSKRMGENKLTLTIDGIPVIERVIRSIVASNVDEVILVYRDIEVKNIGNPYGMKCVYNENAYKGQSESIRLGINNSNKDTGGYMFLVGDQPFLTSNIINRLTVIFSKDNSGIICPRYDGDRGNPVIFHAKYKDALLKLKGDNGGREIIRKNTEDIRFVDIKEKILGTDMDTKEEYNRIKKWR